jgi:hypothetical protein
MEEGCNTKEDQTPIKGRMTYFCVSKETNEETKYIDPLL